MMQRISQAMEALNAAGIAARRRYVPGEVPGLTAPAAAVGLYRAEPKALTLEIRLYCPPDLGGSTWESTAMQAMAALEALGAACTLEGCSFESDSCLLTGRLLAAWVEAEPAPEPEPQPEPTPTQLLCQVAINGEVLPHLTSFSAKRTIDLQPVQAMGAGITFHRAEEKIWTLTLEELLPAAEVPVENSVGSFTLTVSRGDHVETFTTCRWVSTQRTDTPTGVRQVRIARSWEERSITNG